MKRARDLTDAESQVLAQYFSLDTNSIIVVTDIADIASWLDSKTAATWGSGPIKDTDYYQLASFSPLHKGDKSDVLICLTEDVEKARAL